LRERMAMAALFAGLAFSNTKTAIAHSLSYPITLRHGVQHGIACSFSLPMVLRSVHGVGGICEDSLKQIFGPDLMRGADDLEDFLGLLGISSNPAAYKIDRREWRLLIEDSLQGERGRNFLGSGDRLIEASQIVRLPRARIA
jgi:alcohol dehydrogenase class IV